MFLRSRIEHMQGNLLTFNPQSYENKLIPNKNPSLKILNQFKTKCSNHNHKTFYLDEKYGTRSYV